jgi:Holliday junction resolvasome RuvABC DNA-binding subunit
LLHKKGDKKLMIRFFQKDNAVLCEITDNGIGRKHAEEIKARLKEKHQSFATQATEKRVELLNTNTHQNYTVTIEDLYENNQPVGTRVQITISF